MACRFILTYHFYLILIFFFPIIYRDLPTLLDNDKGRLMADIKNAGGFLHPASKAYRFTILIFVSLLTFGSYFAYDSIGAIETTLIQALGFSRSSIGNLYTAYSVAAIFVVFFAGILIDRLGTRKSSLIFTSLVTLGAVVVALAKSETMMFVGRLIFGAGSESLVVAQMSIQARWFKGKELALAFGISLTISRLGTMFSFNTEELIASHFGNYRYALWAAALLCFFSFLANLVYNFMDHHGEKVLKLAEGSTDKIVLSDVKKFNASFWFVTFLCVTFYSAIFPFTALSTDMFHIKWGLPTTSGVEGSFMVQVFSNFLHLFSTAPGITSIVIFASMVCAPFAGHLVDKVGKRASLMIIGSLILIPSHLCMGFTRIYPAYPMIALGIAFVLIPAAMWPSIPLIVRKETVGTAFGLMTMIQNIGLALFPFLNGKLRDVTHSYTASLVMFASLGIVGLVFSFLLKREDRRENILERP
jgi:MFS family permease